MHWIASVLLGACVGAVLLIVIIGAIIIIQREGRL